MPPTDTIELPAAATLPRWVRVNKNPHAGFVRTRRSRFSKTVLVRQPRGRLGHYESAVRQGDSICVEGARGRKAWRCAIRAHHVFRIRRPVRIAFQQDAADRCVAVHRTRGPTQRPAVAIRLDGNELLLARVAQGRPGHNPPSLDRAVPQTSREERRLRSQKRFAGRLADRPAMSAPRIEARAVS